MPGWQLPDQDIWRLVLFIRNLPKVAALSAQAPTVHRAESAVPASYVGSAACKSCHGQIYERWKKTLMANVVRDPREHPDAIIPDLSKPNPLVTFSKDDIAFVYGSRWKQRYFKKVGDDYFPLPAQWDVTHKVWRAYNVKAGTDWWTPYYPADNMERPTGPTCDGCHSVNYDVTTKKVTEWNVGCEKCHGPGSEHVKQPLASNIVNPASLNYVDAADTCLQCHSQGQPHTTPSEGKAYDWPVGFQMGKHLADFWDWKSTNWARQASRTSRMGPATKIECKATTLSPASCTREASLVSVVTTFMAAPTMRFCGNRRTSSVSIVTVRIPPTGPTHQRLSNTPITRWGVKAASASSATCLRSNRQSSM
jgi:hypothetical protein